MSNGKKSSKYFAALVLGGIALSLSANGAVAQQTLTVVSFGGAYLARPNIGLLGSHGVTAAANLAATLLTFGKRGLERRIGEALEKAEKFAAAVQHNPDLELLCQPMTGVVVWRPRDPDQFDAIAGQLPLGTASQTLIEGERWFRNVAANPNLRIEPLCDLVAGLSL